MENKWKPGDIAICIKTNSLDAKPGQHPPLRLHAEYVVNKVRQCECGEDSLDVGLGLGSNSPGVQCSCGAISSPASGIWWCSARRFVKKQSATESAESEEKLEKQLQTAIENEDYEQASILKKKLSKVSQ